ncbi:MAG TPA: hypothetical protein PKU97_12655 [Kofleriaceae bacterium]|nr:hypothetical protein [Kofleriaceae bacterium]
MRHRAVITLLLSLLLLSPGACKGNSEQEGMLAAQRAAEEEAKLAVANHQVAPRIHAPVQDSRKVDCNQLIDLPSFHEALQEKEPLSMRDTRKSNADASAACSLMRGGRILSAKEQEALLKRSGKLGVLAGDELCHIAAFCNVHADEESLRKRCQGPNRKASEAMGTYACETTTAHGALDVISLRFVDPDTHCVLEIRGGPSMTDNDFIVKCAMAARELIGPAQIAEQPPAANEAANEATSEAAPAAGSAAP